MMKLIVQKYGGSSLATPTHIKKIAQQIAKRQKEGYQFIIIVSAMGNTTDALLNLALEVSPHPSPRELDMLLTTGERQSMALLSMALHDLNCDSISFTGSQAGVLTNSSHREAQIIDVKPIRVEKTIKENKIAVIAGFQGVDPVSKEITTLHRGGSDTTAVAFANHFKAQACEIRKDVDGLFSADPKLYKKAQLVKEVTYDILLEMCLLGARVLHTDAIKMAQKKNVILNIGHSEKEELGTCISSYESSCDLQALSINTHTNIIKLNLEKPQTDFQKLIEDFFTQCKLPSPTVLGTNDDPHNLCAYLHHFENIRNLMIQELSRFSIGTVSLEPIESVSISFNKKLNMENSLNILKIVKELDVVVKGHIQHKFSISFFTDPENKIQLIHRLHSRFIETL